MSDTTISESQYVITLVHGTFASRAEWVNNPEKSHLRNGLRRKLEEKNFTVDFETIDWGGDNTGKARLDGAQKLRELLRVNLNKFPEYQILTTSNVKCQPTQLLIAGTVSVISKH